MQFESDYRLDMDNSSSLCSQPMSYPSITTSLSFASSVYDPFIPTSRRPTPHEFDNMHFGVPYNSVSHRTQLTLSSSAMGKFMFGLVKTEPEHISFRDTLSNTPMEREQLDIEHKYMVDMNITPHGSMGSLTPSTSLGMYGYSPDAFIDAASFMEPKIRSSGKRSIKSDSGRADVVRRAMCKCDYPGCHKGYRRNEHLRRHKQTYHGEGPNRFSCEFCRKDQFNRQDNLDNHRRLHARPNSCNRGVEYIPAAVPVIVQEERSRKRRARSKPQTH
ncbi:hypothetical protein ACKRZS_005377 [Fusarium odoratissimum]